MIFSQSALAIFLFHSIQVAWGFYIKSSESTESFNSSLIFNFEINILSGPKSKGETFPKEFSITINKFNQSYIFTRISKFSKESPIFKSNIYVIDKLTKSPKIYIEDGFEESSEVFMEIAA